MVERALGGISMQALGGAQAAAIGAARDSTARGQAVNYVRSMFAPDDGRCFCLFEAERAEDVRQVNDAAGLPYERVTAALQLHPAAGWAGYASSAGRSG